MKLCKFITNKDCFGGPQYSGNVGYLIRPGWVVPHIMVGCCFYKIEDVWSDGYSNEYIKFKDGSNIDMHEYVVLPTIHYDENGKISIIIK